MEHTEVELKWPIPDPEKFFAALRAVSAKVHINRYATEHELNIWYERGKNAEDARRLRISRPYPYRRGCDYYYCVTKKGSNKSVRFKASLEENFYGLYFGSPQKALQFFLFAGYTDHFRYERIRTDFHFNGIVLSYDSLPQIGNYVEIEGDPGDILEAASLLGLDEKDSTNLSYKALFKKWKADNPSSDAKDLLWEDERHFFSVI
ncbi:MAG: hypothetical protein UU22_C0033G0011 [Parcubacteria group bacterium GW2011_GWA2_40_8]|nr:MAG: hypothetical protein UT82_C0004G0026 [Parcubacteria group bacterium GW2011_GWB1_40_14]KKR77944.1 MAG: hypothetical protein UU22_C0033G0011 [Parcubacteria group bacterium GW2011_GWA2_40_8]